MHTRVGFYEYIVKGFPFQLLGTPLAIFRDSPEVGEHTELVLEECNDDTV